MIRLSDLLEAAVAAPDDDAPRRVYADALLEAGDPLGEFIHVQCDLASGAFSREEAMRRRQRERALLSANEQRWTAGPGLAQGFRFVRGFIDELTIKAESWTSRGEELFASAPALRTINLTGLWVRAYDHGGEEESARLVLRRLEKALASPLLGRVEGLGLYPIGYVAPDPIWEMSESIGKNPSEQTVALDAETLELLRAADLSRLRCLALGVSGREALDTLASFPVLGQLERCELTSVDAHASRVLASLDPARLRVLALGNWDDGISRFQGLKELKLKWSKESLGRLPTSLTHLACAATTENFAAISACSQLVELELEPASMEQCRELARLPCAQRLELLRIGKANQGELAELENLFGCVVEARGY